uniref:hypothetical protein n=1 Tax=Roseivirga sp. TaxID=1964215 RepID=UPI00404872AB
MGDKINGVKKQVPMIPYFVQIFTILRLFGENLTCFFINKGRISLLIFSPKKENRVTLVINPAIVITIISKELIPAFGPNKGGKMDLRQANK